MPKRSQRTRSVLTCFAQDADTHNLIYANADVSKAAQNREVLAFADYWRQPSGDWPTQLWFDQRLPTQAEITAGIAPAATPAPAAAAPVTATSSETLTATTTVTGTETTTATEPTAATGTTTGTTGATEADEEEEADTGSTATVDLVAAMEAAGNFTILLQALEGEGWHCKRQRR